MLPQHPVSGPEDLINITYSISPCQATEDTAPKMSYSLLASFNTYAIADHPFVRPQHPLLIVLLENHFGVVQIILYFQESN